MADDTLAERLAAIRDRWSQVEHVVLKPDVIPEPGPVPEWLPDVPRLLAAAVDVLALHHDAADDPGWCDECGHSFPCHTHRAITRALTGEPDATPPAPEAPPGSSETEAAYVLRRLAATAAGLPAIVLPLTGPERDHLAEEFRREYREARAPGKDGPA